MSRITVRVLSWMLLSIRKATTVIAIAWTFRHLWKYWHVGVINWTLSSRWKSCKTVSIMANTLTWLVLLEFLEWPNSPPFVWVFKFWLLLTTVEADVRSKAVSDVSLMPESVIVEEIIDWGSMSCNRWSLTITDVFFFVNEPLPDDPEAMEASSLDVTVCRDVLVLVGIRPVVDDERGFGAIADMLPTRPSSSSDCIGFFDEGLKTRDFDVN